MWVFSSLTCKCGIRLVGMHELTAVINTTARALRFGVFRFRLARGVALVYIRMSGSRVPYRVEFDSLCACAVAAAAWRGCIGGACTAWE